MQQQYGMQQGGTGQWQQLVHDNGQPYYYNTATGAWQWQAPPELMQQMQGQTHIASESLTIWRSAGLAEEATEEYHAVEPSAVLEK